MPDPHVGARISSADHDRLEDICDRYEMGKSALIRLCIRNGLDVVERDGIDELANRPLQK